MSLSIENHAEPTRVQFYHRCSPKKNQLPPQSKTPTNFRQKACLVKTSIKGHEFQIRNDPATDTGSLVRGSPMSGPEGTDPGAVTFDLCNIKSCVLYKSQPWVEITDSTGLRGAIEFDESDPNYENFGQRLLTLLNLLDVKRSMKEGDFDRTKWLPMSHPSPRQLPPIPPTTNLATPDDEPQGQYDYCISTDRRGNNRDVWPSRTALPPPVESPLQLGARSKPPGDGRRRVHITDSFGNESISNSTNSMISSNDGGGPSERYLDLADDVSHIYLEPKDEGPYANDPPKSRSNPQQTLPRANPGPPGKTSSGSSSLASGTEWNCSQCSVWNSSTTSRCKECHKPRKSYAHRHRDCSKERDFDRKDTPWCQMCSRGETANRSGSLDSRENHRSAAAASSSGRRGYMAKSEEECEECQGTGRKVQKESTAEFTIKAGQDIICISTTILLLDPTPTSFASSVDKWRCRCTYLNSANAFSCKICKAIRDDAWQCQVCNALFGVDEVWCQRCSVWRCRRCTFQNDARQRTSKLCQGCSVEIP